MDARATKRLQSKLMERKGRSDRINGIYWNISPFPDEMEKVQARNSLYFAIAVFTVSSGNCERENPVVPC